MKKSTQVFDHVLWESSLKKSHEPLLLLQEDGWDRRRHTRDPREHKPVQIVDGWEH